LFRGLVGSEMCIRDRYWPTSANPIKFIKIDP
jgi:hypothetical protein